MIDVTHRTASMASRRPRLRQRRKAARVEATRWSSRASSRSFGALRALDDVDAVGGARASGAR